MDISKLLELAVTHKASDLHLSAGMSPLLRVNGEIHSLDLSPLTHNKVQDHIFGVMNETQRKTYQENLETDFAFEVPHLGRFRVNAFTQNRGAAAVFRLIPTKIVTLEEIAAPKVLKEIADTQRGLVLVTGPTGSGKSTTLAALIDYINHHKRLHIISIEDPIEFVHTSHKSLIHQREVPCDTLSFEAGLRSALREDPDVILLGEMRDLETIRLALTAAETGHLVFATLHTSSAAKTIDRIIDVFPGEEKAMVRTMLSESLKAIIAQTLVKKIEGGRVAAYEVLLCTPAIRNLIRESKVAQIYSVMQTSQKKGMQTLDQSLQALMESKVIAKEEVFNLVLGL